MRTYRNLSIAASILLLVSLFSPQLLSARDDAVVDRKRNQMIGYILSTELPAIHYSDKVVDDALARAAFGLYIKQLDSQKRFLLKQDVEQLSSFAEYIDDNLRRGTISLPDAGFDILSARINQAEVMVNDLLALDFRGDSNERYQADPEKLDYVESLAALKERWQKILRAQVITRYLDLEADRQKDQTQIDEEQLWQEAKEKTGKRYRDLFHRLRQETLQDHYDRFFLSITRAFDPHTNYIPPAGKEQFDISMRGSLEGIGALLQEEDGFIKVVRIIPGSASARQGRLEAEDVILQVAEGEEEPVDITDMRLRDAVRLIRGPKGTEVRLTVRKVDGTKELIPIIRDVVQIEETFVKSAVLEGPEGRKIGYVFIPGFYRDFAKNGEDGGRNSTDDTRKAVQDLVAQSIDGLILDIRNNGGGALVDAVDIAGLFIDKGPVVQVRNSYGLNRVLDDEEPGMVYDGPLVVLVNKFSASASEIVAGALQDYRRAVIVGGASTHGKGTVQTIIDLNENIPLLHLRKYDDLGALKVLIQKYYRVTGGSTQYKGVEPDIVLPTLVDHIESGERYLDYSLPWDSVEPVRYTAVPPMFDLETIKIKSRERVAQDKGFAIIREEAARLAQRSEQTEISLNIEDMRSRRERSRMAREKVGEYYRKYREELNEDGDTPLDPGGEDSPENDWLENAKDDPYVREAVNILEDIRSSKPS